MPEADSLRVVLTVEQLWQPVPGGSGTYITELAKQLVSHPEVAVTGYAARHLAAVASGAAHGLPDDLPVATSRLDRRVLYELWSRSLLGLSGERGGRQDGGRSRIGRCRVPKVSVPADVIHATTWAIPPKSASLVVTVHDLAFQRRPDFFTPRGVQFFERMLRITKRDADLVITPSRTTADDCEGAGIERSRIRVIPHGVEQLEVSEARQATFRAKYGLRRPFVLWVGTMEPRKNLPVVLAAYALVLQSAPELDLVLIGPDGWGGASDEVQKLAASLPDGKVHVLGHVPLADLNAAYASAEVFCFPSLWEGFGMPVLEAQAHGTPVVTSRATSMAEVCGTGAVLVDPESPAEVAEGILACLGHQRSALSVAALANARQYTWEKAAAQHIAVYQEAAHG